MLATSSKNQEPIALSPEIEDLIVTPYVKAFRKVHGEKCLTSNTFCLLLIVFDKQARWLRKSFGNNSCTSTILVRWYFKLNPKYGWILQEPLLAEGCSDWPTASRISDVLAVPDGPVLGASTVETLPLNISTPFKSERQSRIVSCGT